MHVPIHRDCGTVQSSGRGGYVISYLQEGSKYVHSNYARLSLQLLGLPGDNFLYLLLVLLLVLLCLLYAKYSKIFFSSGMLSIQRNIRYIDVQ